VIADTSPGPTSRSDGAWETALDVRSDAAGDVVAAGLTHDATEADTQATEYTVVKFDGLTGAERWRYVRSEGPETFYQRAVSVAAEPDGDVVAVGTTMNAGTCFDFTVVDLAGDSGVVRWARYEDGTERARFCEACGAECGGGGGPHDGTDVDEAAAVVVDQEGRILAVGQFADRGANGTVRNDLRIFRFLQSGRPDDSSGHLGRAAGRL
jgi:hypothetical protein